MNLKIKFLVINLDESRKRWLEFNSRFSPFDCTFERVSAIDGARIDISEFSDDIKSKAEMGRSIQPGEVGCFLSHKAALRLFVASDHDFCVILEDDAVPTADFMDSIKTICALIYQSRHEVTAVNLGATDFKYTTPVAHLSGRILKCAHRFPMLATGILWTRKGAEIILSDSSLIWMPYDNFLRYTFSGTNRAFSVDAPIIQTSGASSDIESRNRSKKRSTQNRTKLYFLVKQRRIIREKLRATFARIIWHLQPRKRSLK